MNGEYFQNPLFPGLNEQNNNFSIQKNNETSNDNISDILKNNVNKKATFFITDNKDNLDKPYSGIIERSSIDNVIIYNPQDNKYYLIPIKHINYIIFDEKIN